MISKGIKWQQLTLLQPTTNYSTIINQCPARTLPDRHLERMPPVSGLERRPGCHPERSEGSLRPASEILRCAQDDRPYLQMSSFPSALSLDLFGFGVYPFSLGGGRSNVLSRPV